MKAVAKIVSFVLCLAYAPVVYGQSLNFDGGDGGNPVEVFADNGIEWKQTEQMFIARGNARAIRNDVTVYADELQAYYREGKTGGTEIWQLNAIGNVIIKSPTEAAYGDKGVYDLDNAILVLTGDNLKIEAQEDSLTAKDSLEYWLNKRLAVARGDALAVKEGRRLQADVLSASFIQDANGKSKIDKMNAFGNVVIVTEKEVASAQKGVYNVSTGVVDLTGGVKLTKGRNQLNGCTGKVNLKTGVSKLFNCDNGDGRVRGLFQSKDMALEKK